MVAGNKIQGLLGEERSAQGEIKLSTRWAPHQGHNEAYVDLRPQAYRASVGRPLDVVFIDGVWRAACCLKALELIGPSSRVLVHDFVLGKDPRLRRLGVLRTQRAVLMSQLSDEEMLRYTLHARQQVVDWLRANWFAGGPLRDELDALPHLGHNGDLVLTATCEANPTFARYCRWNLGSG